MAFERLKSGIRKVQGYVDRAEMKTENYLEDRREKELLKRKERVASLEEKREKIQEKVGLIKRERAAREGISKARAEQFGTSGFGGLFTQQGIKRPRGGFRNEPPIYQGLGLFSSAQLKKRGKKKSSDKRKASPVKVIIYNQPRSQFKKKKKKKTRNEGYPTGIDMDFGFKNWR